MLLLSLLYLKIKINLYNLYKEIKKFKFIINISIFLFK